MGCVSAADIPTRTSYASRPTTGEKKIPCLRPLTLTLTLTLTPPHPHPNHHFRGRAFRVTVNPHTHHSHGSFVYSFLSRYSCDGICFPGVYHIWEGIHIPPRGGPTTGRKEGRGGSHHWGWHKKGEDEENASPEKEEHRGGRRLISASEGKKERKRKTYLSASRSPSCTTRR